MTVTRTRHQQVCKVLSKHVSQCEHVTASQKRDTRTTLLKATCYRTGNQWRLCRIGVMWSRHRASNTLRVASSTMI